MKFRKLFVFFMLIPMLATPLAVRGASSRPSTSQTQATEVAALFHQLSTMIINQAAQYGVEVDASQAKLFQLGDSPAVIAPITQFDLRNLGLLAFLEVGGPFQVKGTQLPAGFYRMELGGDLETRQLFVALRDEFGQQVVTIPVNVDLNMNGFFPFASGQVGATGFGFGRNPLSGLQVIGPNVNISFGLSRVPPFVRNMRICIGFAIPFGFGSLNISFCF